MDTSNSPLSLFGRELAHATRLRKKHFDSSTSTWFDAYQSNAKLISKLKNSILDNPNVLIMALVKMVSGESDKGWIRSGVHWVILTVCKLINCFYMHH